MTSSAAPPPAAAPAAAVRLDRRAARVVAGPGAADEPVRLAVAALARALGRVSDGVTADVVEGPRRTPAATVCPEGSWWTLLRPATAPGAPEAPPVAVLCADRDALLSLSDLALGGRGVLGDGDRPASPVEAAVALRRLLGGIGPLLAAVSGGDPATAPALACSAPSPGPLPAQGASLDGWSVQVGIAAGGRGRVLLGLPVHAAPGERLGDAPEPAVAAAEVLEALPVQVVVTLPTLRLAAADLRELAPGDVVAFDVEPGAALPVLVRGRPVLSGQLGRCGRHLALRVDRTHVPEPRPGVPTPATAPSPGAAPRPVPVLQEQP